MIKLLTITLSIIPISLFLYQVKKKNFFGPTSMLSLSMIIKVIPISLLIVFNMTEFISNINVRNAVRIPEVQVNYLLLQYLGFIILQLFLFPITNEKIEVDRIERPFLEKKIKLLSYILLFIGIVSFFIVMQQVGGLVYFLNNLHQRTVLLKNVGLAKVTLGLANYSPLVYLYSYKYNNKKAPKFLWIFVFLIGLMSGLGGRKDLVFTVVKALFFYNIFVENIKIKKIFSLRTLLFMFFIIFIILFLPSLRSQDAFNELTNNSNVFRDLFDNVIITLLSYFSYVPYFMFIVSQFSYSNFWYGMSFSSLLTAGIPSRFLNEKLPVDDGMYIYSMALGRENVRPPMTSNELNLTSYPLETFGSMYANFGSIGIIFGYGALGYVIKRIYRRAVLRPNFFTLHCYLLTFLTLELSVLRLVQFCQSVVITYFIFLIIKRLEKNQFN